MPNLAIAPNSEFIEVPSGMGVDEIRQSLPRANQQEIAKSIAMLFSSRAFKNQTDTEAAMSLEVYQMVVAEYPAYALKGAVWAIMKNKAPDIAPKWMPTTDELCAEIERQMWTRIRVKQDKPNIAPVLQNNHFAKKWETLKATALKNTDVTEKPNV